MARESRKGENEAWFRELNERLEDRAAGKVGLGDTFEIVCECVREECTERITIPFADYEAVRRIPTRFIVVPGHIDSTCERVVSSAETYDVIEKFGDAARVAQIENPRNGEELSDGDKPD